MVGFPTRNRLLNFLSASDFALLQPSLQSVDLPQREHIERPERPIDAVVFPETMVVSIVAKQADLLLEIGLIGCEGMTGTSLVLGSERASYAAFVQIAGQGLRIAAADLSEALDRSATMRAQFLKYVQVLVVQTSHTAVANSVGKLHERLARWLLMAHDRVETDKLVLTHEFLSIMLAVRRAGVTEAVGKLEEKELIACSRGVVTVLNRKGLEKTAGTFYGTPEREYRRLVVA